MPLADLLAQLAGGYLTARHWTDVVGRYGLGGLRDFGVADDYAVLLRRRARECELITAEGTVSQTRLAELQVLLDALSVARPPSPTPETERPLVFTLPPPVAALVPASRRLDLLVEDVIACAESELHIGGPFWNEEGCTRLREVIDPAVAVRGVTANFYINDAGELNGDLLDLVQQCQLRGATQLFRWTADRPSLMHAKFVIADRTRGYFGSANFTSLGLATHFEIGVELLAGHASMLNDLLDALRTDCLFVPASPSTGEAIGIPVILARPDRPPGPAFLLGFQTASSGRYARIRLSSGTGITQATVPENWIVRDDTQG